MSWIEKLYKTYENNMTSIGDRHDKIPLLPVSHTTQNAQVTIVIDGTGKFVRASLVPKPEARTIIPATEASAGRTNGPVPHPLCDKLQYVAADYEKYGGAKKSCFADYAKQMDEWCASPFSHPKVCAVRNYVRTGRVTENLVHAQILHVGDNGKLKGKSAMGNTDVPEIFKLIQGGNEQTDAFVRFSVEIPGDPQADLWSDPSVWDSWALYYASLKSVKGLCFVTGEETFLADQHPAKIRNSGDSAKLISSNDTSGFTFRGRFTTADEACGVSFKVTQKAHSALRWLIDRQGRRGPERSFVAWAVSGAVVPDPFADTASLLSKVDVEPVTTIAGDTAQEIGIRLSKMIAGYRSRKLDLSDDIVVMGLDSASPGRMALSFYRELKGSELLERVQAWHAGCCWLQRFSNEKVFVGAPAPRDIAEAAYGIWRDGKMQIDEKLSKATIERFLPCIVDGTPIPRDLVESCVRRASNKQSFPWKWEKGYGYFSWGWEKALGIACALYRYQNKERRYTMALERERKTRDYLYGRLFALAEHMESRALYVAGEKRETNAGKLMQRFAERPYSTWLTIETSLTPYKVRLRGKRSKFLHDVETEMDLVFKSFNPDDYLSDKRLTGEFLLGFHCQRAELRPSGSGQETADVEDVDAEE